MATTGTETLSVGLVSSSAFTESRNTSAPNATVPVDVMTAAGAETNIDIAIVPKGNGAFILGPAPDNTTTGGNKRGTNAVDLQFWPRAASSQVASGNAAFAVGLYNTASAAGAFAQGNGNTVNANYAAAFGTGHAVSGTYGFAIGANGVCDAAQAFTSGWYGNSYGVINRRSHGAYPGSQVGYTPLMCRVTDATATRMVTNNAASAANNNLTLQNNQAIAFRGVVVAKQSAAQGTNLASWEFSGVISRGANAASTTLALGTYTVIANSSTWTLDVAADTTLGCLAVTFTGAAGMNVYATANIQTAEVLYA